MLALSTDQLVCEVGFHTANGYVTALDLHAKGAAFLREAGETLRQPYTEPVVAAALRTGGYHTTVQVLDDVLGETTPLLALVGLGIILKRLGLPTFCRTYDVPGRAPAWRRQAGNSGHAPAHAMSRAGSPPG